MARSADQSQKRNTGSTRVNSGSASYSDTTGRDYRATEDDLQIEDELISDSPRFNTTAIRRTNFPSPRPPTAGLPKSASPIPQRRTGQGQPRPSTSLSDPVLIQTKPATRDTTKLRLAPKKNVLEGNVHWLLPLGIGMIAMVVEFPADNQSGALSYVVPYYILGPGGDLTPITLEFRDVTGIANLIWSF